jgi:LytS/YehU family sensor histidine kinase
MAGNIVLIGSVLLGSLVLYSTIYTYLVYPVIFQGALKYPGFMDIRQVLFGLMDIGFVTGAAVAIRLLRSQLAGKEIEKHLLREKLETELKFLRSQTNPHFLFNTLNNIYGLARKKSDQTAEVVMKLSGILRFMLYESGKDFITISEEIRIIEDYLELERIRYNDRLTIKMKTMVDKPGQPVSPLLLLPFIENAFKHGVSNTRFNSFVNIELALEEGVMHFSVENTKGDPIAGKEVGQIGLSNARRQLELMYKEHELEVNDLENTFKIRLIINLNSHAKI